MLYEKLADQKVHCNLCAHRCTIKPARRGICGVRENNDGVLYSLVYETLIAEHIDPIEKKPFFHVYPASRSYSIAAVGCNFQCDFCQNHEISQMPRSTLMIMGEDIPCSEIVARAKNSGSKTIAYTYTEPTVYFELAYETAILACKEGLENVFVTNGFMTEAAIQKIAPYLAAANVDLKSFRDDFYQKQCGARLVPVLDTMIKMKQMGIWVEITTLLIPGLNDIVISEVLPNGPKDLKKGDIVKTLNGKEMKTIADFNKEFDATKIGATLKLELLREGKQIIVSAPRPEPKGPVIIRKN